MQKHVSHLFNGTGRDYHNANETVNKIAMSPHILAMKSLDGTDCKMPG